jgi:type IV pilus assembly protein PilC
MITAGLTLVEALHILQGQTKKPALTKLVAEMEEEVQGGKSFASVLEKYGNIFPPIYLALVKAGEASGKLDLILGRLADNLEKSKDFTSKVRGALVYPAIIVTGMGIVSTIVMIVVVPRLTSLYKEFGVTLPLPTQILIGLSNFLIHQWIVLVIAIVAFSAFFMKWKKTWFGRHMIATASLNMPIFGSLIKEATLVEVTRTLAILIDSGIPILTALEISRDATGNVLFKEAFLAASAKVEKGFPLSEPLVENRLFPPILGQMVAVGEQTGKLGDSLLKLSRYFETEADTAVRSLTTLIEPLIMVVLGLGVGFLVMAVLLPIYSLTSKF